ncbi:MAG: hypothetical protein MMC23_009789 [Stictis urceolatum]|nr:hypothetical protein [Stictis urceolata]
MSMHQLDTSLVANNSASPSLPSDDPWYTAPNGFAGAAPGAILRVRNAVGLSDVIANCSMAYNILYRTTDSNYMPSWAVTTVLVPDSSSRSSAYTSRQSTTALLSQQLPYDSADVNESPSYALYAGNVDPAITAALGLGWYVNVPDYEGPLASFTAGVQSGHATLDSVRAVLGNEPSLGPTAKYVLNGYSGGALASEWAAELQVQYAPELNFAGASLGGLTPNITSVINTVNRTPYVGLVPNGIIGLLSQNQPLMQYVFGQLKTSGQYNATTFLSARNLTFIKSFTTFVNQDIFDYFADGPAVLQNLAVRALVNRDGVMGYHGVPAMPIFAYKAIGDDVSVIGDTDALIERYCAIGANIKYERNTIGNHAQESLNGAARAMAFLKAVVAGTYINIGCAVQNVTVKAS